MKRKNRLILLCIGLALCCLKTSIASGPAVSIKSTVDKPKITIGDKITYNIIIAHDPKIKITLPDIASNLEAFEIKDYKISKPKKKKGKLVHEHEYIITTFTTGEFKIAPSTVTYINEKGEEKEVSSRPISIFVESVKPSESDKDDIRDIKAPLTIKYPLINYFLWIGIPLLILTGFSVYYFTRKKKGEGFFAEKESKKPADELAYERLDKLKEMELIKKGEIKHHYIILSEIIRRYMETRYNIPVLDRTTYELYQELQKVKADKKHSRLIRDFLDECDMVKFARYKPEEKTILGDFESAKKIVDVTKPALTTAA